MTSLRPLLAAFLLLAVACSTPPDTSFVASSQRAAGAGEPAGTDAKGGACVAQPGGAVPADLPVARSRDVFCGGWSQPAARVVQLRGPSTPAQLDQLASGGLWYSWLQQRVTCAPAQPTTVGGAQARLLNCTRKNGGWPHVALVVAGAEGPVVADGVLTAAPAMERVATGRTGGAVAAAGAPAGQARSEALEMAVRRMAAESFGANDVGQYETLINAGRELNLAENYAAAEDAYRAALALQERVLGRDDPNVSFALVHLALNLANQGRAQDAEALFRRADRLAPRAADTVAPARLAHYRGLAALAAQRPDVALPLLREADQLYTRLIPPGTLDGRETGGLAIGDPTVSSALLGLAEVRRNLGIALARTGEPREAQRMVADSRRVLRLSGAEPGMIVARSYVAQADALAGQGREEAAATQLETAAKRFAVAAPGERPEAVALFRTGATRLATGRRGDALSAFRTGAAILRARQIALPTSLVLPYLDALDAEANASPGNAAALRREMFGAAQLAQRSDTVRFVQQASARIGAAGGDPKAAEAVRRLQDADQALRELFNERDASPSPTVDTRIATAQRARAEAEAEVAAAAPGYRQLLLSTVDAEAVARVLNPREAMMVMLFGREHGWVMVIRDGVVRAAKTRMNEEDVKKTVAALRAGTVDTYGRPVRFDPAPSMQLYAALIAPFEAALQGAETLIVAPDGPLLAVPFAMLLRSAPPDPEQLGNAEWLIKRHAIVHVPSPQTLVTLRGAGLGSNAPMAYAGFGDFIPPSTAQLQKTFPEDRCAADARLASGLTKLPGTRVEVELAQQLIGASRNDIKLGADFTLAGMKNADLGKRRIVHLATHALLPGELSCLPEPSIILSPMPGAPDASSVFLKASDLLGFQLDADLVILSACNTGGPGGGGGGEALSGLARAFFYAGARGLMVTHWAVDDAAAALTVADSLRRQQAGASSAAALRGAQLLILEEAGRRLPAVFAHPFYWAPFALLGDGRRAP